MRLEELFLLLLFSRTGLCQTDLIFRTGKLEKANITRHFWDRGGAKSWKVLVNKLDQPDVYGVTTIFPNIIVKITNFGQATEGVVELLTLNADIKQIIPTYFTGLPFLVMTQNCLAWLLPNAQKKLQVWRGSGCDNVTANYDQHPEYRPTGPYIAPGGFYIVEASTKYIFLVTEKSKAQNLTTINALDPLGTSFNVFLLDNYGRGVYDCLQFGNGYLYFVLRNGFVIGRFAEDDIMPTTNYVVAEALLIAGPSNSRSFYGPWTYGSFDDAVLPRILQLRYFKRDILIALGEVHYKAPVANSVKIKLHTMRILDMRKRLVKQVCMDPGNWSLYTEFNNGDCVTRFPFHNQPDTPTLFTLLTYNQNVLNLYMEATVPNPQQMGVRLPQNWAFDFGTELDGFTEPFIPGDTSPSLAPTTLTTRTTETTLNATSASTVTEATTVVTEQLAVIALSMLTDEVLYSIVAVLVFAIFIAAAVCIVYNHSRLRSNEDAISDDSVGTPIMLSRAPSVGRAYSKGASVISVFSKAPSITNRYITDQDGNILIEIQQDTINVEETVEEMNYEEEKPRTKGKHKGHRKSRSEPVEDVEPTAPASPELQPTRTGKPKKAKIIKDTTKHLLQ